MVNNNPEEKKIDKRPKRERDYEEKEENKRGKQILEHRVRIRRLTKGRSLDVDAYQQTDGHTDTEL